jgi:hypothetical protein
LVATTNAELAVDLGKVSLDGVDREVPLGRRLLVGVARLPPGDTGRLGERERLGEDRTATAGVVLCVARSGRIRSQGR